MKKKIKFSIKFMKLFVFSTEKHRGVQCKNSLNFQDLQQQASAEGCSQGHEISSLLGL